MFGNIAHAKGMSALAARLKQTTGLSVAAFAPVTALGGGAEAMVSRIL